MLALRIAAILAVLATAVFGAGLPAAAIALSLAYMPYVARVLRLYGAPLTWELQGSGIQQVVGRDGSVTYTNVAPRRFTTVSLQAR